MVTEGSESGAARCRERDVAVVVDEGGGCVDAGLCSELVLTGVMQRCVFEGN